MPKKKDFTPMERHASLTFLRPAEPEPKRKGIVKYRSYFMCECGKEVIARNESVRFGLVKSCGCSRFKVNIKHGQTCRGKRTRAYRIWAGLIARCTNPNKENYKYYGGSGITVCERWRKSFADFFSDMGPGKIGWSIERIGNKGNYEPGNCVWATMVHQNRNRRSNLVVTVRGVTACLIDLVDRFGGNYNRIRWRLNHGWEPEKAFFQPEQKQQHKVESVAAGDPTATHAIA